MSRAPKPLNPYSSWSSLFGATVRRLRLGMRAGRPLTQGELGKQIGYSDATVGAVERSTLRPDTAFMEGCERVLPADGMLHTMLPFVLAEWQVWEQTGQRPTTDPLPPAEILSDPLHLSDPQDLIVVQEANSDEVLELARQAEASDPGGGTLEMIDRTVDRLCRDYPTAVPSVLVPRVQQRLRFLVKLLEGKITLGQHRHLLVAGGWLATLLACLQFDLGDREAAEASQAAAYMFARQAEHQELLAWTYELLAWWALVDRRYHEVIEYSRTGLRLRPTHRLAFSWPCSRPRAGPALVMLRGRTSPYAWRVRPCRALSIPSTTLSLMRASSRSMRRPATRGSVIKICQRAGRAGHTPVAGAPWPGALAHTARRNAGGSRPSRRR
jgi:hypothetical protein